MEILLALLIGLLYAAGIYLILRRSILKFIIGIIILSNATNLLVFLSAGIIPGSPAFTAAAGNQNIQADPLPQALVLTANNFSSSYLENKGKYQFELSPLPFPAQLNGEREREVGGLDSGRSYATTPCIF